MKVKCSWLVAAVLVATVTTNAFARTPLEQKLQQFDQNTRQYMQKTPEKWGAKEAPKFSRKQIQDKSYIEAKNKQRKLGGRAAIGGNDRPEHLVDLGGKLEKNLAAMDKKGLTSAKLPKQPWSDYYWALFAGQTAFRYNDANYPNSEDWKKNFDYMNNPRLNMNVELLSPAEKYDLLVGDERKGLTKAALAEGEQYYRSNGSVERWMGICHGWAPAAYMLDRPANAIKVMAADGKTVIPFYPSDIKALGTLLWAQHAPDTKFIGGRCNVKEPKTDVNGRVIDQSCFDNNPGAWHMAVVNQIGISKRSMVLDATFDYEVWNQPIVSYSYTYFNPQTLTPAKDLKSAAVKISDFSKDKFKKYRSANAAYVVGVEMVMAYTVETLPNTNTKDSARNDAVKEAAYEYDLELDAQGNIIGGEWYTNLHPDFLWTPDANAKAVTPGDMMLARSGGLREGWDGRTAMPRAWQDVAKRNTGSPLAVVVETLINLSNKK